MKIRIFDVEVDIVSCLEIGTESDAFCIIFTIWFVIVLFCHYVLYGYEFVFWGGKGKPQFMEVHINPQKKGIKKGEGVLEEVKALQLPPQGDLGASVTSPTSVGFLAWVTASFSCLTPCPRLCLVRVCGASDPSPVILVSKHVCATPLVLSLFFRVPSLFVFLSLYLLFLFSPAVV